MENNNRPYTLFCDTTCDLPSDRLAKMDCKLLPLSVEIDGKTFSTDELSMKDFYELMRNGASTKTSQIPVGVYETAFEQQLIKGNDILYLAFSSGLSGSYSAALIARDDLAEKFPEQKIIVVDSLAASSGEGLLLILAEKKKREGCTIEELEDYIIKTRQHIGHVFTVDDLKYLFRGGRVSRGAAIAGSMLGIKPLLTVDNEGHLIPMGKVRGRKASIKALGNMIRERAGNYPNPIVTMSHGDCEEDADAAERMLKEIFGSKTEVVRAYTGPIIGAHSGPGTLALFFYADHK